MARLHTVKKSRKAQGPCGRCGETIGVGESYLWWKFKRGGLHRRCHRAECRPRYSEYGTTSPHLSGIYSAQERFSDAIMNVEHSADGVEEVASLLETFAQDIREVAEGYTESADNMVEGFGHETYQSEEIREKAEALEGWADEVESAASDLGGYDTDDETIDYQSVIDEASSIVDENPM